MCTFSVALRYICACMSPGFKLAMRIYAYTFYTIFHFYSTNYSISSKQSKCKVMGKSFVQHTSFSWHNYAWTYIPYAHAKLFLFWHNSYKYSFEHYHVLSSVWYLLTNWLSINFKFPMWEYYVVKLGPIWTQFVINPVHMYEVGLSGWFCPSVLTNVCLPCGNVWNLNKCCMWRYYDNITSTW